MAEKTKLTRGELKRVCDRAHEYGRLQGMAEALATVQHEFHVPGVVKLWISHKSLQLMREIEALHAEATEELDAMGFKQYEDT